MKDNEKEALNSWLSRNGENRDDANVVSKAWELSGGFEPDFEPDVELALTKLKNRIASEKKVVPLESGRKWWLAAASVAILVISGLVFRNISNSYDQIITITAIQGEKEKIELPDGSIVLLNENSTIQYEDGFTDTLRSVQLSGEAFFEVVKDENRPFIVQTVYCNFRVLGTSFNVRAYDNEKFTELVVKTGKVSFEARSRAPVEVEANKKATFRHNSNRDPVVEPTQLNELAWQSDHFDFLGKTVSDVLPLLKRQLGVEINFENKQLLKCSLTSTYIPKDISVILNTWKKAFDIEDVQIERDKVYRIIGGKCPSK